MESEILPEEEPDVVEDVLAVGEDSCKDEAQQEAGDECAAGENGSIEKMSTLVERSPELPDDMDLSEWVKAGTTDQERAQRARRVAESKNKQKTDEQGAKLKIFTGAKFQGKKGSSSRASTGQPLSKSQHAPASGTS
jgi:hypothetical protein